MRRVREKLRSTGGMSFAEMLIAVLLVGLVSMCMATGVSTASRNLTTSMRWSESKTLSSTLITVIEDELAYTTRVQMSDNTLYFQSQHHANQKPVTFATNDDGHLVLKSETDEMNLVGRAAYTNGLSARVTQLEYDQDACRFTVTLELYCGNDEYQTTTFNVLNVNNATFPTT
ncbi:MAG: hypothetical protein Q4E12_02140 [Coriobacteriia bacterium]|nr:hypothetical protein [Coriobacteriia bacterium]